MDEESENWDRYLKNLVGDKGSLFTCHCQAFSIKWQVLVSLCKFYIFISAPPPQNSFCLNTSWRLGCVSWRFTLSEVSYHWKLQNCKHLRRIMAVLLCPFTSCAWHTIRVAGYGIQLMGSTVGAGSNSKLP